MARTYTVEALSVANARGKNLISLQNATGSGGIVRIWKAIISNYGTGAVTGGNTRVLIGRKTGTLTGGTSLTTSIRSMDTTDAALSANITCTTNSTGIVIADLFKAFTIFTDEYAVGDATGDMLFIVPEYSKVWNSGYDVNVQPIVIRENEVFTIQTDIAPWNAVGTFKLLLEFSVDTV